MASRIDPACCVHTLDGVRVEVAASVDSAQGAHRALENGAHSIGLLRSEGLYRAGFPTEDALYAVYCDVFAVMGGGRVIARICDFGGDNRPDCLSLPCEINPQMGFRSIRMLLSRPELFEPHLRALLRASAHGRLALLLPMVSTVDEVLRARALLEETRAQLTLEGASMAHRIELGVMVENPAAALICDQLARYVDFFCIGTHTLTQFTLVTDRSSLLYQSADARSTAVLRLVHHAVERGLRRDLWCGVIGASASDPALIPSLLALGITLFSVEPAQLACTRDVIQRTSVSSLRAPLLEQLAAGDGAPFFNSRFL